MIRIRLRFPSVLIILSMVAISALSCAGPPKWARDVHWQKSGLQYFVGVSTKAKSEEQGRREAYDNAVAEAIQSLFGIQGKVELASFANLQRIQISQDVFISSDEVNLKPQSKKIFVERVKGERGEISFNVYRLIAVDDAEARREIERLKALASSKGGSSMRRMDSDDSSIVIPVEGIAVIANGDEIAAKAQAIRNGISKSCEALIANWFREETRKSRFDTFDTMLYSRCPSFMDSYEVDGGHSEKNIYKINMTVKLKSGDIQRRLMGAGIYREKG